MRPILKFLLLTVFFTGTCQLASAYFYITTALQGIATCPNGGPCATVEVTLWDHVLGVTGTEYDIMKGRGVFKIGDCGYVAPRPDCADPVAINGAELFTEPSSPVCAGEWLQYPGVTKLVQTALAQDLEGQTAQPAMLRQVLQATDQKVILFPNPATRAISIRLKADNLNRATLMLIDNSGKMISRQSIATGKGDFQMTKDVSQFARGTYTLEFQDVPGHRSKQQFVLR